MYPTISHLIKDLTGWNIPLPIQSFGFMMALAFLFAAYTLYLELKRRESLGLIQAVPRKIIVGQPASISDLVFNGVLGFLLGWKGLEMALHYGELVNNPQQFILSDRGNIWGGLIGAAILMVLKYRSAEKEKLPKPEERIVLVSPYQMVGDITIYAAIGGLLGAKLFDNLEHWDAFVQDPIGELFSFSGLTFYGGLILGSAAALWYSRKNGLPLPQMLDAAAPGLMLAYGIGRIGCQLAGDGDWGIVNTAEKPSWFFLPDWFWSYQYPHNVLEEGIRIDGCVGRYCYQLAQPVYPTPLYETAAALVIFSGLWFLRRRITVPAMLFSIYLFLNGLERFFIEKIRVNIKYHFAGIEYTQAELLAVIMMLLGIAGMIFLPRYYKRKVKASTGKQ